MDLVGNSLCGGLAFLIPLVRRFEGPRVAFMSKGGMVDEGALRQHGRGPKIYKNMRKRQSE